MEIEFEANQEVNKEKQEEIYNDFFIEAWSQNSMKLELLKGKIRDNSHMDFSPSNNIIFWTKKGIGIIALISLIEETSPYKNFISSKSIFEKVVQELNQDPNDEEIDANIWRQVHKLGSKMQNKEISPNTQLQILKKVNKMEFSFRPQEIKDMILRDCARKEEVFLTHCVVSKTKRDPFLLAMSNIGEVNLVYYSKAITSINLNELRIKKELRTKSNFVFEEENEILIPKFKRVFYTCMETISINAETSLIFLADSEQNLNFFSKKSIDIDLKESLENSIQLKGTAQSYGYVKKIYPSSWKNGKIELCTLNKGNKIGIIHVEISEEIKLSHKRWIQTDLDFISHCFFNQNSIYLSEYGDIHKITLEEDNDPNLQKLVSFNSKIVSICQISKNEIFAFLENGLFYKIDTIEETKKKSEVVEHNCQFLKTNGTAISLNGSLVSISGNRDTFTNKFITKIMIHPAYSISSRDQSQTLLIIKNFLECFKDRRGNYNDLIYCLSHQNSLSFVKNYLEKIIYKEGNNKKTNELRERILDTLVEQMKIPRNEIKLLIFAFYSNIFFQEKKQITKTVFLEKEQKEADKVQEKKFTALKVKMIKKYWLSKVNEAQQNFRFEMVYGKDKNIEKIEKWLQGEISDFMCPHCGKMGEVELDFATLVVGCGNCGEMSCVDDSNGNIVTGDEVEWFCYCCGIMFPGPCCEISRGVENEKVDSVCFLCFNSLSLVGDFGIGLGV